MKFVSSVITSAVRSVRAGAPTTPDREFHSGISLNFASGIHYVKASGAVPTVAPLTTLFTFTGGNQSYYMGPAGLLIPSVTNTPRIEYDTSGNPLGLLMEAARTNLGLHSDDHTNAAWVKTTMTTAKTSTGPDGVANSATRLTATAGNATSLQTVTSASATRAYSVWMRRVTGSGNIQMTLDNGVGWTTKTLTTSWQRFDITQAAVTNPVFGVRIVTSGDAIDVYGNQMESAAFPSSLIPTTTVAVARTADSCIRTLGAEFSAPTGSMVLRGRASGGQEAAANQFVASFDDGTLNNQFRLMRATGTDTAQFAVIVAGVPQANLSGTFVNLTAYKSAAAWAANDFAHSFNGAAALTDAAGTLPTVTTLNLGCGPGGGSAANGHIRTFDYWPERKRNGELVRLSSA